MRRSVSRPEPSTDRGITLCLWAIVAIAVSLLVGLAVPRGVAHRESARFPVLALTLQEGRVALRDLEIRPEGRATPAGERTPDYDRAEFGTSWQDMDGNGCDTRNDILARDLHRAGPRGEGAGDPAERAAGTDPCVVTAGSLDDPYTGATIAFERGKHSARVQIDHVVALADAWVAGAWRWESVHRARFANDPDNLLAVSGSANQDKGAKRADEWLPDNSGYHCVYVLRQVKVKRRYALSVTRAERAAMSDALDRCATAR